MAEWIYFINPPRQDFIATMTEAERELFRAHAGRLRDLVAQGVVVLAGPTLGSANTGIVVFEAPDETAARRIMEEDPVIAAGIVSGRTPALRRSRCSVAETELFSVAPPHRMSRVAGRGNGVTK